MFLFQTRMNSQNDKSLDFIFVPLGPTIGLVSSGLFKDAA